MGKKSNKELIPWGSYAGAGGGEGPRRGGAAGGGGRPRREGTSGGGGSQRGGEPSTARGDGAPASQRGPPSTADPKVLPPSVTVTAAVETSTGGATVGPKRTFGTDLPHSLTVTAAVGTSTGGSTVRPKNTFGTGLPPLLTVTSAVETSSGGATVRPKNTLGTECDIIANHFVVEFPTKQYDLYKYEVTITPYVRSKILRRRVFEELVKWNSEELRAGRLPAYDGRNTIYAAGELLFQESQQFNVKLEQPDLWFQVVINNGTVAELNLQLVNLVLRQLPSSLRYSQVGGSVFENKSKRLLGNSLHHWSGFYRCVHETPTGMSLILDTCDMVFIEPQVVSDFVAKLLNLYQHMSSPSGRKKHLTQKVLTDEEVVKIEAALRGVWVENVYRGRKHRISGLTKQRTRDIIMVQEVQKVITKRDKETGEWKTQDEPCMVEKVTNELTFDMEATSITVSEYFRTYHDHNVEFPRWPCLQVGTEERPIYLPVDRCKINEGQRFNGLDNEQFTALIAASSQLPAAKGQAILKKVKDCNQDSYAKEFGIKINEEMTEVKAHILPSPRKLRCYFTEGQQTTQTYVQPQGGVWNFDNRKLYKGGLVGNWFCVNFSSVVGAAAANKFCQELAHNCNAYGMKFSPYSVYGPCCAEPKNVEADFKKWYNEAKKKLRNKLSAQSKEIDLVVVILPDQNGSLYGEVKRICETVLGVVSQCCLTKHVIASLDKYLRSVALKINVKVGGQNTVLDDEVSNRIFKLNTIVFGADVSHPHPGDDSSSSIAAVVASQDLEGSKYAGLYCAQAHRQEIISDLFNLIKELLESFKNKNGKSPDHIVFYRDGVCQRQFDEVLNHELEAIRRACKSIGDTIGENYQPLVTFVVVQKRHHTRLFQKRSYARLFAEGHNVSPGTVVDSGICHGDTYEFYLCSHAATKGTSRPAHYHVLCNENCYTANDLVAFTNYLCYIYGPSTRSISTVAPVYYAHLLAYRARYYMTHQTSPGDAAQKSLPAVKKHIRNRMFFC